MNILEEADNLINGDRASNYGDATENFNRIAVLFEGYLGVPVSSYDVANLMMLVKIARLQHAQYHRDSYADIAGYAALAEKVHDAVAEELYDEDELIVVPRKWDSLDDVPHDVDVRNADGGARWHYYGPNDPDEGLRNCHWLWSGGSRPTNPRTGPFTEILKGSE